MRYLPILLQLYFILSTTLFMLLALDLSCPSLLHLFLFIFLFLGSLVKLVVNVRYIILGIVVNCMGF